MDALQILKIDAAHRLPRIFAYFDDIYSSDLGHVTPRVGVPLAIAEFNAANKDKDVSPLTHLEFSYGPSRAWHRQIYSCGDFSHPLYNSDIVEPTGSSVSSSGSTKAEAWSIRPLTPWRYGTARAEGSRASLARRSRR